MERKAVTLARRKQFDESIESHMEAIELFKKCLEIKDNKHAFECIQLQKEWNERQISNLQIKKSYFKRLEKQHLECERGSCTKYSQGIENLEDKIFKNFETHDSLICYLAQKGIIESFESNCNSIPIKEEKEPTPIIIGNKHPKNESTVIEELKELSGQLRESVQGLLTQLDDRNKEIEQLKEQIKDLELERSYKEAFKPPLKSKDSSSSASPSMTFPVTTDHLHDEIEIKSLPPLEDLTLPEIDIAAFKEFHVPEFEFKFFKKDD
ncbi:uncharacterized protein LOC126741578 isoform X2 [Anthonomus grandis grandis]|nr:uncharacterized protein LOC126741578 isoform X2 [Anthonomus grandis grandis]